MYIQVSDSGQTKVDDDGRLIIEKVIVENGGNYTCVAENLAGRTEKFVQLIVTSMPVLPDKMKLIYLHLIIFS